MKSNYGKKFTHLLDELKKLYPGRDMSLFLFGALAEYDGNFWGISDKELFYALDKYREQLAIDEEPEDITQIYEDALNLDVTPYTEDEDEDF